MDTAYKALADPTRREILALLRRGDMTAGELAKHFEIAKPTLSGHFSVLKRADLIQGERSGTVITYRLNVSVLEEAMLALLNAFDMFPSKSGVRTPRRSSRQGRKGVSTT